MDWIKEVRENWNRAGVYAGSIELEESYKLWDYTCVFQAEIAAEIQNCGAVNYGYV